MSIRRIVDAALVIALVSAAVVLGLVIGELLWRRDCKRYGWKRK